MFFRHILDTHQENEGSLKLQERSCFSGRFRMWLDCPVKTVVSEQVGGVPPTFNFRHDRKRKRGRPKRSTPQLLVSCPFAAIVMTTQYLLHQPLSSSFERGSLSKRLGNRCPPQVTWKFVKILSEVMWHRGSALRDDSQSFHDMEVIHPGMAVCKGFLFF